ncbi:hypothetical protein SAMN04487949_0647 [Halogranum gelatinilyticum]|uniref:Uncharacterized protein n=1 Tax=Halogranum gelatinilyticum TaxID=660521 RepID=A0A1G9Q1H8_9EURY|nr:hypothetical protein [Halogranum gelatinilyticum]SDM04898.1 hypothetical protein SAMN04487949_0647 [Halogranum gelatinilyticum]
MSSESDDSEPGVLKSAYRTVTPGYKSHPDTEMNVIGLAYFLGILVLLVPLLPFIVLVWLISKLIELVADQTGSGETK